ncbi:MAG: helix-turn-helix domain-containing protein [Candidatus Komeilibacteria bacterium]|nr:helix-turn-helix domain-containing protein [Candidatus Komeilibacteria bacterium]
MISPTFLVDTRKNYGWTQEEMASVIGISRPTYVALEKGEGSLTIAQLTKLANKLGCQPEDILAEQIIDENKYQGILLEAVLSGAGRDGKIPKTKLAKLIYLADFGWYYQHLESITGAQYRKLPQGPVPNYYFSAIDDLFDKGLINIEIKDNAQLISLTDAGKQVKFKNLTKVELDFVRKVAKKWQEKRTNEIVAFTHQQLPYKVCTEGEIIPYELITQQDPENVY